MGLNRPIPGQDMHKIESQLRSHFREEKKRKELRRDLLRADPYENSMQGVHSRMTGSGSSSDLFYSLDLHDSFMADRAMEASTTGLSSMSDSFVSTNHPTLTSDPRTHMYAMTSGTSLDDVSLGEGSGLEQLLDTSPVHRTGMKKSERSSGRKSPLSQHTWAGSPHSSKTGVSRATSTGTGTAKVRSGHSQQDLCKYSLLLSGVTLAILEANPTYTHLQSSEKPAPDPVTHHHQQSQASQPPCSMDNCVGLDPISYFEAMAELLRSGINRKEIQACQSDLAQILPRDHLL